jgi:hypothetical protein
MFPPLAAHHAPHLPLPQNEIGFYMLSSDGQIPFLQNDFLFLKVFQLLKR